MRRLLFVGAMLALTGCAGTQLYTQQDLRQVKQAYITIRPIYLAFRQAFYAGNASAMRREYRLGQRACQEVAVIDSRDSIDPNTNLFQASIGLDNFCNDIERAYVGWEKCHGLPHDKHVVPSLPREAFQDGDLSLAKMTQYLRHPAALA